VLTQGGKIVRLKLVARQDAFQQTLFKKKTGLAVLVGVGRCHKVGILQGLLQEAELKVDPGIHSQALVACASLCFVLIGLRHAAFQVAQVAVAAEEAIRRLVIAGDTCQHDAAAVAFEPGAQEADGPEQVSVGWSDPQAFYGPQ
jgi:hypothetical protein